MRRYVLPLMFVLPVVLLLAGTAVIYADSPSGYQSKSEPSLSKITDYVIGFKGPNKTCRVETIAATSSEEARSYARQLCPECVVKDLTGSPESRGNMMAEAPWEIVTPREAFCGS
ncbi:MAG TPA: hypothetical protein VGK71_03025 [Nitrospirota bacterium]|jgi:hypothetical protein